MDKIEKMKDMICDYCFVKYPVPSSAYNRKMYTKRKNGVKCYCSTECQFKSRNINNPKEVKCLCCDVNFYKHVAQIKKYPNNFCS